MKPGVYYGMSFEEYRAIDAINKSGLDHFEKSPAHFYANCLDPKREVSEPTPAMRLGTAIHTAILEPGEFHDRYSTPPPGAPKHPTERQINAKKPSPETLSAIAWWSDFEAKAQGKEILSAEDLYLVSAVATRFRGHPAGATILETGSSEIVLVWVDPIENVLCKARVDWLSTVILDLKSAENASPNEFARSVARYRYHVQAAFYTDGYERLTGDRIPFVFGVPEKEAPWASAFYSVPDQVLEVGRKIYRRQLARYARCKREERWPSYAEEIVELRLPAWALKEENHDIVEF